MFNNDFFKLNIRKFYVVPHCRKPTHKQAHLVLQTHTASVKNQKSLFLCQRPKKES
jgi:hypothetical protein